MWVFTPSHSLTLSYTPGSMWCDSQASSWPAPLQCLCLDSRTSFWLTPLQALYLGREPKARVTIMPHFIAIETRSFGLPTSIPLGWLTLKGAPFFMKFPLGLKLELWNYLGFPLLRCLALGSIPLHGMPSCEGTYYPSWTQTFHLVSHLKSLPLSW